MAYRADRMFAHLGYRALQGGSRDVSTCRMAPSFVRLLFQECEGIVPQTIGDPTKYLEALPHNNEALVEPILSQSVTGAADPVELSQSVQQSEPLPRPTPPRELRQLSMTEGFNISTKQLLDKAWSTAFYEANIPFNVTRHPAFVNAVRETARLRMPAYTPPSFNAIRTKLLTTKKADLQTQIKERLGNSIAKYGVTICCDGWDNVQNRPLLNVVQCGTKGDVFLGTIDTTGNHKDHIYIAAQIHPFIQLIGSENVVQVCTDNAPVMASAGRDVMQSNPHIYVQGCAAHCLDLLLEDWGKEDWVKKVVKKARVICLFIKNHHAPQAIFRRMSPNLALRLPLETRFATNFIMIDRLVQLRNALDRMVLDEAWRTYITELRRISGSAYTNGIAVRCFMRSDGFWNTCEKILYMVIPVVKALRVFDGTTPAMGLAWKVMYDLEAHVRGFTQPPFGLSLDLGATALVAFKARWGLMITDLHWAGAMLNPLLRGWAPLHENEHARPILNRVFRRLTSTDDTYIEVIDQYQDFLENRGAFADSTDPNIHVVSLHEWWDAMGGGAKALQIIARRILGQVCSASACERNWSMYSFVHNKVRNRLKHDRAEDLVYIYTNSRLLRHRRGPRPAQWYGLNAIHSDDESDGVDHDDGLDFDQDERGSPPVDDENMDDLDFNLDDLDVDDPESDGDDSDDGASGNMGIFDFNEGDLPQEHVPQPSGQDPNGDGPSFGQLCSGQGLWVQQGDVLNVLDDGENVIPSTQTQSDSLSFGVEEIPVRNLEETNVIEPTTTVPRAICHILPTSNMNTSFDSTRATEVGNLPDIPTMSSPRTTRVLNEDPTLIGTPAPITSQTRPLTRSIASANRLDATIVRGIGATLVSLQNILPNSRQGRARQLSNQPSSMENSDTTTRPSLSTPRRRLALPRNGIRTGVVGRDRTTIGIASSNTRVSRGRSEPFTITNEVAPPIQDRHVPSSSGTSFIGRRRTTRGIKRRCRNQGRATQFVGEDYDPSDGRPNLDDNGICDAEGSRPTRRLVVTRNLNICLQSTSPQSDDNETTDESDEDPRCVEANDPTVRMRTS
jgi:Protein of unknown function (DUF 659)/hAT family C-terminal dimerisation region